MENFEVKKIYLRKSTDAIAQMRMAQQPPGSVQWYAD